MSEDRKKPAWPWITALLIGLPVVYILSSGPAHGVAFRNASIIGYDADGTSLLSEYENWWPTVYAPLVWASERSWGKPLRRYWNFIESKRARE
jgi:hypothetical protein